MFNSVIYLSNIYNHGGEGCLRTNVTRDWRRLRDCRRQGREVMGISVRYFTSGPNFSANICLRIVIFTQYTNELHSVTVMNILSPNLCHCGHSGAGGSL